MPLYILTYNVYNERTDDWHTAQTSAIPFDKIAEYVALIEASDQHTFRDVIPAS